MRHCHFATIAASLLTTADAARGADLPAEPPFIVGERLEIVANHENGISLVYPLGPKPLVGPRGGIAFVAAHRDTGFKVYFAPRGSPPVALASAGDQPPDRPGYLFDFRGQVPLAMNAEETVAAILPSYLPPEEPGGFPVDGGKTLYRFGGGTPLRMADTRDPLLGGPIQDLVQPLLNASGQACFTVLYTGGTTPVERIYVNNGFLTQEVVATGDWLPPLLPPKVFGYYVASSEFERPPIFFSDAGDVAFPGSVEQPDGKPSTNGYHRGAWVWRAATGETEKVVIPGDPAPEMDGPTIAAINGFQMSSSGHMALTARLSNFENALWRIDPQGTWTIIARDRQTILFEGGARATGIFLLGIGLVNGRGQVAFAASGGNFPSFFVPIWEDGVYRLITKGGPVADFPQLSPQGVTRPQFGAGGAFLFDDTTASSGLWWAGLDRPTRLLGDAFSRFRTGHDAGGQPVIVDPDFIAGFLGNGGDVALAVRYFSDLGGVVGLFRVSSGPQQPVAGNQVNSVADAADADLNDGQCSTGATVLDVQGNPILECTLRAALENANAGVLPAVRFAIRGPGPHRILPAAPLPAVTATDLEIDGTSQPGYQGRPLIEIDGSGIGEPASGLVLQAAGCSIRGLAIHGFKQSGIRVQAVDSASITGCFLGLRTDGEVVEGNGEYGIDARDSGNAVIGGAGAGAGNVISGNDRGGVRISGAGAGGAKVLGNLIGTDPDGLVSRPNQGPGIEVSGAPDVIIGGGAGAGGQPSPGNLISGNQVGVSLLAGADRARVLGNLIGTDRNGVPGGTGVFPLGNERQGVSIQGAAECVLGGAEGAARNTIAGNDGDGIAIESAPGSRVLGNRIEANAWGISVSESPTTVIGGAAPDAGNIVSGNKSGGIRIQGAGSGAAEVLGNLIGADEAGAAAKKNEGPGIEVIGAAGVVIGGAVTGGQGLVPGNLIAAGTEGIRLGPGADAIRIQGNLIGTDVTGLGTGGEGSPLGNRGHGILIEGAKDGTIGGDPLTERNVISGNAAGGIAVRESAPGARDGLRMTIQGNLIGTALNRQDRLPNRGPGIHLLESRHNELRENTIWFNDAHGVRIEGADAFANRLVENSIHGNDRGGIIRVGGSALAAPWIDRSWHEGKTGLPGRTEPGATVEVFVDPPVTGDEEGFWGQGKTHVITLSADAMGKFEIDLTLITDPGFVTATATEASGETSEFSSIVHVLVGQSATTDPPLLVAGKPTVVRFFTDSGPGGPHLDVGARIEMHDSGAMVIEEAPFLIRPRDSLDERARRGPYQPPRVVILDPLPGTLEIEYTIIEGDKERLRSKAGPFEFQSLKPLRLGWIAIRSTRSGAGPSELPDIAEVDEALRFPAAVFPVNPDAFLKDTRLIAVHSFTGDLNLDDEQLRLALELEALRRHTVAKGQLVERTAGFVGRGVELGGNNGLTYSSSLLRVSIVKDTATLGVESFSSGPTLAHELGHQHPFSLGDEYAGGKHRATNPLPTDPGLFDKHGVYIFEDELAFDVLGELSFPDDVVMRGPKPVWIPPGPAMDDPEAVRSFMGRGPHRWTNAHSWGVIFRALGGVVPTAPVQAPGHGAGAPGPALVARGILVRGGGASLRSLIPLESTDAEDPPPGDGDEEFEIVLLDAAGAVLASRTLRPNFEIERFPDSADGEPLAVIEPVDAEPFSVILPADPAAVRLAVRFGGNEVAAIARSPNPPQVTLFGPSGPGELPRAPVTVRWSASDPDLPDTTGLTFNVLYTPDGGRTVVPAGVDLTGIDSHVVDAGELPGGPEARFIIEASDSWHRSRVQSEPPFPLADAAPTPGIRHPQAGAELDSDVPVVISGFAYDLEDGFLVKSALRWFLDGAPEPVASGREALVEFAAGEHTLRLAAMDSAGHEASVEVSFTAGSGPSPPVFRRGDADANGTANITDAIFVLQFLFLGGREPSCRSAADSNDDSQVNISDPILLLNALFVGTGTVPAPGFLECGPDPTADDLGCQGSTGCEN